MQIVRRNRDICDFAGNLCAIADSNADICRRQRRRIIDTVTNHNNLVALFCFLAYKFRLILRQNLGKVFLNADLFCDCCRGVLVIPRHHYDSFQTKRSQIADYLCRLCTQGVFNADNRRQPAVNCQIQVRILLRQCIEFFLLRRVNRACLIFKYKMVAANHNLLPFYGRCNAVCNDIFHLGMGFFVLQTFFCRRRNNRLCHRMREMLLQTGRQTQQLVFLLVAEGVNPANRRLCLCQCACFIEYDGICFRNCFQIFAALYGDMIRTGFADCRKHGDRHRKLQCAGEVNHQYSQCLRHISCQRINQSCPQQGIRNQSVRQMLCSAFHCGFQLFGILNHGYDFFKPCGAAHFSDL